MDVDTFKAFEATRSGLDVGAGNPAVRQMDPALNRSSSSAPVATQLRSAVSATSEAEREKLQAAVSDIQGFVQSVRRDINFNLDEDSGRVVANVTAATSGDVIRQIPSEEALRLAENLSEIRSVLFEAEA